MTDRLIEHWRRLVRSAPEARAVIDAGTGRVWTRVELAGAAREWRATHVAAADLAGQLALMAEPNGPAWFHVFLGLLEAGAVVVAGDATEPDAALRETARELGAARVWVGGSLEAVSAQRVRRRKGFCLGKLTSGSTGLPRVRLFTDGQMIADGRQVCASMGIGPDDLNLAVIPLGHSYGLGNLVVPLLVQGTPMVCPASPLPHALAADCARWRPTVFPAVPTLLSALARAEVAPDALASLRLVISAGAPLAPEVAVAFSDKYDRRIHSFYGSTETGGISFDRTGQAALTGRSVGTPMEGVRLHFRAGRRFTVESEAVLGRGRFSPPDRAMLDDAGEVVLLGRTGRSVKIAGRRLDPGDVERALLALDGVRAAHAMAHPGRPEALAAAVLADLGAGEIRAGLAKRMAAWKIPERIVVVQEWPVTARGKTDVRALRSLLAGR